MPKCRKCGKQSFELLHYPWAELGEYHVVACDLCHYGDILRIPIYIPCDQWKRYINAKV